MAFDVSYRYMPADEQNFLVDELARMKREGRVEALRERRNSIHVYVFRSGPPAEALIASQLETVEEARRRPRRRLFRLRPAAPAK